MAHSIWHFLLLAAALVGVPASGQEFLSWGRCLQEAVRASPELAGAQSSVRSAEALWRAEEAANKPNALASAGVGLVGRRTDDGDETAVGGALSLRGEWNLYSAGRLPAKLAQRQADLAAAEGRAVLVRADLEYTLRSAFVEVLYARQLLPLLEEIARHRRQNADAVELRYQSGLEHKGSLATSEAACLEASLEAAQAQRALRLALQKLARAMGRRDEGFDIEGELDVGVPPADINADACVSRTAEYRLACSRLARSATGITVARSVSRPDLDAVASLTPQTDEWSSDETRWFTGLRLSYLLPLWRRSRYEADAAVADRDAAQSSLEAVVREIANGIESALAEYQTAAERVALADAVLRAAELRAEVARREYTGGFLSFVNWDLAETDFINRRKALLRGRRDACLARARWERVFGQPSARGEAGDKEGP